MNAEERRLERSQIRLNAAQRRLRKAGALLLRRNRELARAERGTTPPPTAASRGTRWRRPCCRT